MRRWLGFNYLAVLMGDLACTLQNHLNPALFGEGRDVNEKLMAFFQRGSRLHVWLLLLFRQLLIFLFFFSHPLISSLNVIAFVFLVNFVWTWRAISLIYPEIMSYIHLWLQILIQLTRESMLSVFLQNNNKIAFSFQMMKYPVVACHIQLAGFSWLMLSWMH